VAVLFGDNLGTKDASLNNQADKAYPRLIDFYGQNGYIGCLREQIIMAEGRILLVDDKPSILASYGRSLAESGFEVIKAERSEEALGHLRTASFDVVLTDFLIPEANGLALLEKLHTFAPQVPIIVMLDKLSNKLAVEAAERGVLQSLVKPISGALLRRTIARAVQSRRSRQHIVPSFLARGGRPLTPVTMNATDAKNQMGRVLETVMQGGVVLISKHESPKAAVISIEEYERFSRAARIGTQNWAYHFNLAHALSAKQSWDRAINEYRDHGLRYRG